MKKIRRGLGLLMIGMMLLTGCGKSLYMPSDSILENLADNNIRSFYADIVIKIYENEELTSTICVKQYRAEENKIRDEINQDGKEYISICDGTKYVTYSNKEKEGVILEGQGILDLNLDSMNFKDGILSILDIIGETHNIEVKNEEKIDGRITEHIVATPKQEDSMIGKWEMWADRETWCIVKECYEVGNQRIDAECLKFKINPDLPKDLFKAEIPKGYKITTEDEYGVDKETISLEEAIKKMKSPIFTLPEGEDFTLEKTELYHFSKETGDEVDLTYRVKGDRTLVVTTLKAKEDEDDEKYIGMGQEEKVTVRGNQGEYIDSGIKILNWREKDLYCTIVVENSIFSKKELLEIAEQLELTK